MKKSILLFILASMAITASACNISDVTGTLTTNSSEKQEPKNTEPAIAAKDSSQNTQNSASAVVEPTPVTAKPAETNEDNNQESPDGQTNTEQSSYDNSQSEETEFPGPDTAALVNLRGDTTTVYKLADGRYMDRTNTVYIYDGTDTWTDESGVEWNETAQISNAEKNVQDPYDLYSWDLETGTYIPYQQAEGTGEPIGRGNGWYYYDDEAGAYIPW